MGCQGKYPTNLKMICKQKSPEGSAEAMAGLRDEPVSKAKQTLGRHTLGASSGSVVSVRGLDGCRTA